jgi:hypothetical protein
VSQQAFSDPPEAFGIDGRLIVSCGEVIEPTKPNPDCSLGTARGLIWEYPPKGDQLLSKRHHCEIRIAPGGNRPYTATAPFPASIE